MRKKKRAFLPLIFFGVFEKEEKEEEKEGSRQNKNKNTAIHL